MAVAQAQHVVKELMELLEANGCEVNYGIHPVAGRMPGHMNVLLAEADVPYDQLLEMDDINPRMESVDVAIVIGANDVVNPAAREVESSPIYGMPVINVADARTVFVLKRSMAWALRESKIRSSTKTTHVCSLAMRKSLLVPGKRVLLIARSVVTLWKGARIRRLFLPVISGNNWGYVFVCNERFRRSSV